MNLEMQPQSDIRINHQLVQLLPEDPRYPKSLKYGNHPAGHSIIKAIGNFDILKTESLAMFCSTKCPGQLILQTYDLARSLREAGVTVIGGFHSPMERECLSLLLRGHQPVIICPARGIEGKRLPKEWKLPLHQGRLLLLSPFEEKVRRTTADLAKLRNKFVAAIAAALFIAFAAPGSKTEQFSREMTARGKPLLTLQSPDNAQLIALGATAISIDNFSELRWQ
jgi:predicted Rossmann fold nucleotide-binding protein DprA/Smf involved in DNA uptake